MKDPKTLFAAGLALGCSALAFFLLYGKAREIEARSRQVPVLVARQYLPAQSALRSDRIERRMMPEAFVPPGALSDPDSVEGLVSIAPFSAGEPLLANKFARAGTSLPRTLEPGERAYCLTVDSSQGVGGLLRPGDRVDVLARYESAGRRVTAFALQDVRVLAAGGVSDPAAVPEDGGYDHVTLALSPEQSETLAFLEDRASLKLVLRPDGDEGVAALPPVGEAEVLSRLGRAPVRGKRIEVIRGPEGLDEGDVR